MAPQRIKTAFATAERTAEVLGVPPARTRRLILLAKKSLNGAPVNTSVERKPSANAKKTFKAKKLKG